MASTANTGTAAQKKTAAAQKKTPAKKSVPSPRASTKRALVIPDVTAEIVQVTPALAEEWLKGNISNRKLNERTINLYTRDMLKDRWPMNGEAVKRAVDGTLLDGQHRLHAVVRSGKTVPMLVISNLPRETQETMDIGRKRNAADTLALRGEKNTSTLGAVARRIYLWDKGDRRFREAVTFADIDETIERFPGLRRSAEVANRVSQSFRYLPASALGTAHHLFSRTAEEEVPWFFAAIETGADLKLGNPVLTLRERVRNDRETGTKVGDVRALAYIIRAWNAHRRGETLARIQHPHDQPVPDVQ